MAEDELEPDTLGDRKSALFVILSDTDSTFNFVAALMYSQLFNLLCDKADDFYGGRLPVHVRCLLDEFANIGQIPNFDKLIATIRSREISASIILQSQSQLKTIYKDAADTIVGNCDSTLFLGGKEKSTLKGISELLGKETIDSFNQSENRGSQISHGLNYFVDEFHLLLKEEQTAAYSAEIWKRFRKWGGVPTGATQNPKDLLSSPEIENILENSDFIYMLNQAAGDRKILAERLNISPEQLAYVTNSDPGHGLLFFNNVILPFADDFPKDTELYKLLTTKPSEVEHAAETEA